MSAPPHRVCTGIPAMVHDAKVLLFFETCKNIVKKKNLLCYKTQKSILRDIAFTEA